MLADASTQSEPVPFGLLVSNQLKFSQAEFGIQIGDSFINEADSYLRGSNQGRNGLLQYLGEEEIKSPL